MAGAQPASPHEFKMSGASSSENAHASSMLASLTLSFKFLAWQELSDRHQGVAG
jgi:hypothetical protein